MATATMYCVKCRTKRDAENVEEVTMKNGKKAAKGKCPVCGTSMFKIGGI
jgi:NAD-dependent SIR2 family protein deacetylase